METKNRLKEFEIQKKLGFGSYGVIFRVSRRSDKQTFVLKQIDLKNLKEKMRKNVGEYLFRRSTRPSSSRS